MDFAAIDTLRRLHPAWRLLRADNAPLILGFLSRVFVDENARSVSRTELISRLDDELYAVNKSLGDATFPKSAKAYLDDWSAAENGWLRKYYPPANDEPHYDITPPVERAIAWLASLEQRQFIGTESRLNTIFELLKQMAYGAETDPEVHLRDLRRQRDELDRQIADAEQGDVPTLDATAQRERYQQFASTARELLADFREVEDNFRKLDRQLRETIATWDSGKGQLLDDVLGNRNAIADSDQGRSFQAFYDFLLSPVRQEEFADLLDKVQRIEAIDAKDARLRHVHHDWLQASERTQATVRQLSDQLRRFLDDQAWLENRRAMDLLKSIEATALKIRDDPPTSRVEIDGVAPTLVMPMERPLYTPSSSTPINSDIAVGDDGTVDSSALFEQIHVDRARLASTVRRSLQHSGQVCLVDIIDNAPLEHGLAELVCYFSLDDDAFDIVFDEDVREHVTWDDSNGVRRVATVPRAMFVRTSTRSSARSEVPAP